MPRTIRLKVVEEPPEGTRAIIDLSTQGYMAGTMSTARSAGLLQQLCGSCGHTLVQGRPHMKQDGSGQPILLRCAKCRSFNEMNQD